MAVAARRQDLHVFGVPQFQFPGIHVPDQHAVGGPDVGSAPAVDVQVLRGDRLAVGVGELQEKEEVPQAESLGRDDGARSGVGQLDDRPDRIVGAVDQHVGTDAAGQRQPRTQGRILRDRVPRRQEGRQKERDDESDFLTLNRHVAPP